MLFRWPNRGVGKASTSGAVVLLECSDCLIIAIESLIGPAECKMKVVPDSSECQTRFQSAEHLGKQHAPRGLAVMALAIPISLPPLSLQGMMDFLYPANAGVMPQGGTQIGSRCSHRSHRRFAIESPSLSRCARFHLVDRRWRGATSIRNEIKSINGGRFP